MRWRLRSGWLVSVCPAQAREFVGRLVIVRQVLAATGWLAREVARPDRRLRGREGYSPSYREIAEELGWRCPRCPSCLGPGARRVPGPRARTPRTIVEPARPYPGRRRRGRGTDPRADRRRRPRRTPGAAEETYLLPQRLVGHGALFMLRVEGTR